MPIYTNDPCDDGVRPFGNPLYSSVGIGPKVTKAIDAATKEWLDDHPEATTTVEDDSITNAKLKNGSITPDKLSNDSINTVIDAIPTMSPLVRGIAKVGAGLAMNGSSLELDGNGDIATAVTSWLNAHPEATTTVQDGAITFKKLADGGEIAAKLQNELSYSITADMLEIGRIDDSGEPASHSSRCRTQMFLPVSAGDKLYLAFATPDQNKQVDFYFYDTTKMFQSNTGWIHFEVTPNIFYTVQNDGYFKCVFNTATMTDYDNMVVVSHCTQKNIELYSLESKLQMPVLPIPASGLNYGYWANSDQDVFQFYRGSNFQKRITNIYPINVNKGDTVCYTKKNSLYADIMFKTTLDTSAAIMSITYTNFPFIAPSDGYVFVNFKKSDNSVIDSFADYANMITVRRANEIGAIETTKAEWLYNGYVNENSYLIANNATRLVNWMPIHANKGDVIRINSLDLMFQPYEFTRTGICVAHASSYITPSFVGGSLPLCGDYIVQNNDCWVMVVIAPMYGTTPESFLPTDYPDAFSVIHMQGRQINTAEDTMARFPKAARKPIQFDTRAIVSQACTIIDGKLWAAVDTGVQDNSRYYIQVINLETGAIEKTIAHNLGHCNCLDYCEETDTLMTIWNYDNRTILLYPNVSSVTTSIARGDCVSVPVASTDIDYIGTCCFGQDSREFFAYCGKGSATEYNLYRGTLGVTNGDYDGSYTIDKLYNGVIRDNIDTHVVVSQQHYAQDSCYDGYFYMGYGTGGHNFLVIDLDEIQGTYRVVGNYLHHEYDDSRAELATEPEGIALLGNKVYCLSRQNTIHASYFNVFNR